MIEEGYCECGCGQKTNLRTQSNKNKGFFKGEPHRFIQYHHNRGKNNPQYNGGKTKNPLGYIFVRDFSHHKSNSMGYIGEHILVAEKILGKYLPDKAVVHHVDGNPSNNNPNNLVICENSAYHLFLHRKIRAKKECGNANWRKCKYCKQYDDPENLYIDKTTAHHRSCQNEFQRKKYKAKKEGK